MKSQKHSLPDGTVQLVGDRLVFRNSQGRLLRRCDASETIQLVETACRLNRQLGHSHCDHPISRGLLLRYGFVTHGLFFNGKPEPGPTLVPRRVFDELAAELASALEP